MSALIIVFTSQLDKVITSLFCCVVGGASHYLGVGMVILEVVTARHSASSLPPSVSLRNGVLPSTEKLVIILLAMINNHRLFWW